MCLDLGSDLIARFIAVWHGFQYLNRNLTVPLVQNDLILPITVLDNLKPTDVVGLSNQDSVSVDRLRVINRVKPGNLDVLVVDLSGWRLRLLWDTGCLDFENW
jgi:hypothetical protein